MQKLRSACIQRRLEGRKVYMFLNSASYSIKLTYLQFFSTVLQQEGPCSFGTGAIKQAQILQAGAL